MASLAWSFLMLLLVLAAVPASLWAMKRLQTLRPAGGAPRAMEVVASLPLGPRERLVTVRVADRTLVLGVTAQQVALVTELHEGLPGADAPPPAAPGDAPFAAALRRLR